jgi:beta-lactam-binding protein with PASTA domain
VIYAPAKPGERVGVVVRQMPAQGTASAEDHIELVVRKSLGGVVPDVVGLPLPRARARLASAHFHVDVHGGSGGKVVQQAPEGSTAGTRGETVAVTVKP